MDTCPCCSDVLLRHVAHGSLYWFCRSCWAKMPSVEEYCPRAAIAAEVLPSLVVSPQRRSSLVQYRAVAA
jgi:hypothetical protein